jgi:hypothetical protein
MKAILSFNHPGNGAANRAPEVAGAMPPGITLLGFCDGPELLRRDAQANAAEQRSAQSSAGPGATAPATRAHAAFSSLVAIGSIALLAFGR